MNTILGQATILHMMTEYFCLDHEFTFYGTSFANLFPDSGSLNIQPAINDENFVENRQVLPFAKRSCTGDASLGECRKDPRPNILPPTQSARITTKESFTFTYGVIDIEAKLPVGDWIISEIWLVPAEHKYGPGYQSGKIRLLSRGNSNLKYKDGTEMGCETVEGSVVVGCEDKIETRYVLFHDEDNCARSFRDFRIIWTPDDITFIANKENASIMEDHNGKRLRDILDFSNSEKSIFNDSPSRMAPFDQPFYISIGVSAGGIGDFEDDSETGDYKKPWKNDDPKAMYKFWEKREDWMHTWRSETSLTIKSIKVTAL